MIWLLSILAFVVIFSALILIHEFGHFYVARRCGIKVEEFGLGMPPRLWGWRPKKSETLYSFNAIPFGGFVRLYGEDVTDKKAVQSKRSFVSKKPWQKLLVVTAGVLMNFLLAWLLLVLGFTIGMQPLLVTPDDVYSAIDAGVVKVAPGIVVKTPGENDAGFEAGDLLLAVNGKKIIWGDEVANLADGEKVTFLLERRGSLVEVVGVNDLQKPFFASYDLLPLPQLVVKDASSVLQVKGLRPGEVIGPIEGKRIYNTAALEEALVSMQQEETFSQPEANDDLAGMAGVVVSMVLPGGTAETAGLLAGDEIVSINGVEVRDIKALSQALTAEILEGKAVYKVRRGQSEIEYYLQKDAEGTVGVMLAELVHLENYGLSVYARSVPHSILAIEDVNYPLGQAMLEAFKEIGRLSVLTVHAFVDVFRSIFTRLSVPEGVAGPVGIAQMTFVFVQEGVMSLIRFTALLSMSLAIINILPFPGLDGGRFFLILIPALLGKKINPRWEAMVHVFGFLLLMLLLLFVTFNDLARLFG